MVVRCNKHRAPDRNLSFLSDKPVSINRVILQEDISKGERVLKYTLKGKMNNEWIDLSSGTCIGHKHINRFEAQTLDAIKLVVDESKADPLIMTFQFLKPSERPTRKITDIS